MLAHISTADFYHVESCTTAHNLFVALRTLHESDGSYTQIGLLLKALDIRFSYDTPFRDTLAEIRGYFHRITAMGKIKDDDFFSVILLHSMSKHFTHLQQAVLKMTLLPDFNSEMVVKRILDEDALIRRRRELDELANLTAHFSRSNQSAFAALNSRQRPGPKPICSNCKRKNHSTDYCISPGGKMAGRSVKEARAAFKAAH